MKQGSAKKDQDGDIDTDVKPYMKPCRGRGFQNDATRLMIVRANVPYWPKAEMPAAGCGVRSLGSCGPPRVLAAGIGVRTRPCPQSKQVPPRRTRSTMAQSDPMPTSGADTARSIGGPPREMPSSPIVKESRSAWEKQLFHNDEGRITTAFKRHSRSSA